MGTTIKTCHFCGNGLVRKESPSTKSKIYFCNTECKAQHQKKSKPVTREWLIEHYINKGLDSVQIARMVNRDPKSVWSWLKDFGIPTRPRGFGFGSFATRFKKGKQSAFAGKKHTDSTRTRLSEIAKRDGRVPFDPAIGPPLKGKRGSEVPTWKGGITPERQKFYSSPEWKAAVKQVWKRDNAACQRCGCRNHGETRHNFDIHHIAGFEVVDLRAVLSNLVLLCERCHYWVHSNANANREFLA